MRTIPLAALTAGTLLAAFEVHAQEAGDASPVRPETANTVQVPPQQSPAVRPESVEMQPNARATVQADGAATSTNPASSLHLEVTAADLIDRSVLGDTGQTLGVVTDIVDIDDRLHAVMISGGFLRLVGTKSVALALSTLSLSEEVLIAPYLAENQIADMIEIDTDNYRSLAPDEPILIGGV